MTAKQEINFDKVVRILGIVSPIALPLLAITSQQQWTFFRGDAVGIAIVIGFIIVGFASGALIRSWWTLGYLLGLAVIVTSFWLFQPEYPGSEGHSISIGLFFMTVFLALPASIVGVLVGQRLAQLLSR